MESYSYDNSGNNTVQSRSGYALFFTYDALGQRIAKRFNGVVTRFVWRGGHVIYETDGGGTVTRSYTWGSDEDDLLAIHDHVGGGHYYVVQDKLRSVRALVDRDGVWRASWRYGIYGNLLYESGQLPFALRFRWAGAQYDAETDLYYMRSRYYHPAPGRFVQEDRAGRAGGMDLYAYAAGDPTSARDPSGMGAEPMPESRSPYACLGTIRGCGDTSGDNFLVGGGGGGGGGWMDEFLSGWDVLTNLEKYSTGRLDFASGEAWGSYIQLRRQAYDAGDADLLGLLAAVQRLDIRIEAVSNDPNCGPACAQGIFTRAGVFVGALVRLDFGGLASLHADTRVSLAHELGHTADWAGVAPFHARWGRVANDPHSQEVVSFYYEELANRLVGCPMRARNHARLPVACGGR